MAADTITGSDLRRGPETSGVDVAGQRRADPIFDGFAGLVGGRSRLLPRPSMLERSLTVVTLFVLGHQAPNAWFLRAGDVSVNSSNTIHVVLVGLLMLSGLVRVLGYVNQILRVIHLDLALVAFAGLGLVSTLWSADLAETFTSALLFLFVTFFAIYMVLRYSLEESLVILSSVFLLSGVVNLLFVQLFPLYGITETGEWSGVFFTKNQLGYVITLGIPTLLVTAFMQRGRRLILFFGVALLAFLLIMSQSTTALVATLLVTASLPAFRSFRASYTLRGAAIILVIGGALLMAAVATNQIEVVASWAGKDPSLTGRTPLWRSTIDVILERPLVGHGFHAAFGGYFSPTHDVWVLNQWEPPDSHNAVLQIWVELGLIGVILFTISLVRAFSNGIRIAAIVPGPIGLWPLTIFSLAVFTGISESGIQSESLGWVLFVIAALTASGHLAHRSSSGLSNDLRQAITANKASIAVR